MIVPMTSANPRNPPAVSFDKLDRVSNLHSKSNDNMAFSYPDESMLETGTLSKP